MFRADSPYAKERLRSLQERVGRGETVCLVGLGAAGHNSGVALIEVSAERGIHLVSNDEEERFTGVKHCADYPERTLSLLRDRLAAAGRTPADVHAWLLTWDYPAVTALGMRAVVEEFPQSWGLLTPQASPTWHFDEFSVRIRGTPARLAKQMGFAEPQPLIALPHHENHAAFSYAASPFGRAADLVMIAVLDGFGDCGAISFFTGHQGRLEKLYSNGSLFDSLGLFYSLISSTQGGWTTLSSEGRYMGAVAWGDHNRLTNPFYKRLREIFHFGPQGTVHINRSMVNWHCGGEGTPYRQPLIDLLGEPIPQDRLWNPDAILRVDDVEHSAITRDRVDIAAATQLVFEDVLFHVVAHLIRLTGSDRLVLTGGAALNCLANMQLLDQFDRSWYRRNLGKDARLQLWVPPTPGDPGVTIGAAYQFALRAGVSVGEPLRHAFYCGRASTVTELEQALQQDQEVGHELIGHVNQPEDTQAVADLLAFLVSRDGVVGLFQGVAESGPRALGHRSILANPCNPRTLENVNLQVKLREPIRPLAPMVTLEAAQRFFHLSEGAAADNYSAYNFMVLTVMAKPEARELLPAVVHRDGTARIQIVRPEHDPLCHAYLKAIGRRLGVEASVNTSLNVGNPIAQTPAQAFTALHRAKALTALVLITADGNAHLLWDRSTTPPKDAGRQLHEWLAEWRRERAQSPSLHSISR